MISQYTILVCHLNQISSNTNGTEIKERNKARERNAVVLGKSLHQFKAHSTSAQMLERIRVVGTFWIQDCHSRRKYIVRHVMVTDDKVNT